MLTTKIRKLYRQPPTEAQPLRVEGWVRTLRESKNVAFVELNDGSFFAPLQVVLSGDALAHTSELSVGAAVAFEGECVPTPGQKQPFELQAHSMELLGACPVDYPLQKKRHSLEFLRTQAHLRPRTNTFSAVFRIRSLAAHAIHCFFQERDFVYVHTPIITGSDCEGAGEMMRVTTLNAQNPPRLPDGSVDFSKDFFGKPTSLTVSGQLNAECYALALRDVYTFGPTFRAENSNTPRHAAEFWMIEPEVAFADLDDVCQLAEDMIKYVLAAVLQRAPEEFAFLDRFVENGLIERLEKLRDAQFARISYTEAIALLEKADAAFEFPVSWGCDIQTEHERYLCENVFHGPVFVQHYPKEIKSFYMRQNDDGKTVAAADMLVPGVGELIGGSQREERYDVLQQRIQELGMELENYDWYLELRKYGGCKHAGFGMGFERFIMFITGMSNIRDVLPFPRTARNADF